jgi:hypothetical protein
VWGTRRFRNIIVATAWFLAAAAVGARVTAWLSDNQPFA